MSLRLRLPLRIAALASLPLIVPGIYGQLAAFAATTATAVADRLTVATVGAGPDVVLIPGLASSAHVWDVTAAHLAATHRVQVAGFCGAPAGANAAGPIIDGSSPRSTITSFATGWAVPRSSAPRSAG